MGWSNRCGQRGRPKKLAGSRDKYKLRWDKFKNHFIKSTALEFLLLEVGNVILGEDIFPPFEQPSSYKRGDIRGAFKSCFRIIKLDRLSLWGGGWQVNFFFNCSIKFVKFFIKKHFLLIETILTDTGKPYLYVCTIYSL